VSRPHRYLLDVALMAVIDHCLLKDLVRVQIHFGERIMRQPLGVISDLVRELLFIAVRVMLGLEGISFELRRIHANTVSLPGALRAARCALFRSLFIGSERGSCARGHAEKKSPRDARPRGIGLIVPWLHMLVSPYN